MSMLPRNGRVVPQWSDVLKLLGTYDKTLSMPFDNDFIHPSQVVSLSGRHSDTRDVVSHGWLA